MNKKYEALEKELIKFYNQSRKLFDGVPPGTPIDIAEASSKKPVKEQSGTFFTFEIEEEDIFNPLPLMTSYAEDKGKRSSVAEIMVNVKETPFHNRIAVNALSPHLNNYIINHSGFEECLLHEMIHLKDEMLGKYFLFEHQWSLKLKYSCYVNACHLIAETFPLTKQGYPKGKWNVFDESRNIERNHGARFMTLCYFLAKNLLKQKRLLKRVLNGRKLKGNTNWEKTKWLAIRLYREMGD